MRYVTLSASSCHKSYNQYAAFQLIKTTSPHHQRLVAQNNLNDIVMNTSYSLLTADLLTQLLDQQCNKSLTTGTRRNTQNAALQQRLFLNQQLVTQSQADTMQLLINTTSSKSYNLIFEITKSIISGITSADCPEAVGS
ncbi:hypothetical protein F511_35842 [Dorcoceras hygrometricum]|uniref:Uncharacterized protein n=1 Tax=Dorcoceras hygrometricum TaxID=472368 RepID=A0A2Z7CZK3_9LAMI|nr:hypothetical protein F511_35842 [Dorcoceras hygrometricum]